MNNNIIECQMSESEIILFEKYLINIKGYIEFGCGGSTFTILNKTNAIVYSVESDLEWINKLKEYTLINDALINNRLLLKHINIGKVGKWGKPIEDVYKYLYPNYSTEIFNIINKDLIDIVLIDGRFRVSCCLKTIEYLFNKDLKIIIHDFWNRKYYHILLKYLDVIESVDTMCIFKIKNEINFEQLQKDYDESKYSVN